MQIYDELVARGLIAQVTDEDEIKKLINEGKATFYIGFDPTADSLHVDVDEIRFLFPGLAFEIAVAGDGEAGHRKTGLRTPQLWVAGQSTHDNNLIQHRFPPPVLPRH